MAISTKRDQIFVCVVAQPASRVYVVDLEVIGSPAVLASPSITFQHFDAKFAKNLRRVEVPVAVVGNHSLNFHHLLREFHFLCIWKQ